jgi:hypothetical protein
VSDAPPNPAAQPGPPLPQFYHHVVGVNPSLHGGLRLDRSVGYAFAARAQSVPLGLGEFEVTCRHYPILFTTGAHPAPVALMGVNEAGNLFVLPEGGWRPDSYIPAYIRAFPFIYVEDEAAKTTYVGMEEGAACLRRDTGAPLFEDGQASAALNEAIKFCSAYRDNLVASNAFGRALADAGVLQEEEATVNFKTGGSAKVRGFQVVKPERLDAVSDEVFLDWRRRGWIPAIYAHLHSASQWGRLIDLAAVSGVRQEAVGHA